MSPPYLYPPGRDLEKIRVVSENSRLFIAGVHQLIFIGQSQFTPIPGGTGIHPLRFRPSAMVTSTLSFV
jgi:hypothetical protein